MIFQVHLSSTQSKRLISYIGFKQFLNFDVNSKFFCYFVFCILFFDYSVFDFCSVYQRMNQHGCENGEGGRILERGIRVSTRFILEMWNVRNEARYGMMTILLNLMC